MTITKSHRLAHNFRNTAEIAAFAAAIVEGLSIEDDGTLPDFSACVRHGPIPRLIRGKFSRQVDSIIKQLTKINLREESVGILHAKGGGWFDYLRSRLSEGGFGFVDITRQSDWPTGDENIALSTLHSAKGLEFDHVILPGLDGEVTPAGDLEGDSQLQALRRLVAMGAGRAHKTLTIGFRRDDQSEVLNYLAPGSFERIDL